MSVADGWYSSSTSVGRSGSVEVKRDGDDYLMRRSGDPKTVLRFSADEWDCFIGGVENNEFDSFAGDTSREGQ